VWREAIAWLGWNFCAQQAKDLTMKSPVAKRSIVIKDHKTSVSLEEAFWIGMKEIAAECNKTLSELTSEIDSQRQQGNLSSAIRLFVLHHYQTRAARGSDAADKPTLHAVA
jgi:predicted DNA-binding ribbon-helix-helix protein